MSHTLYEEAIAEARRLTEMAEQNAKNKIIDAVTPQIKALIEQELMGAEDEDLDLEGPEEETDDLEGSDLEDTMVLDLDSMMAPAPDVAPEPEDEVSLEVSGDEVEIEIGGVKIEVEPSDGELDDDEEVLLDQPIEDSLEEMLSRSPVGNAKLLERLKSLGKKVQVLRVAFAESKRVGTKLQKHRIADIFESLAREAVTLHRQVILTEKNTGGRTLETEMIGSIIKEMKDMSRRNNKNVFDFLFEAEEDDEGLEPEEAEADEADEADEGGEEVTVDVDTAKDLLVQLGDAMDLDVDVSEPEEEAPEEEAPEEEELLDLGEGEHEDEMEEISAPSMGRRTDEMVYELDEETLRDELRRLRSINEEAVDAAESFGGGDAEDDMFVDVDEETLLNALADELGDAPMPTVAETRARRRARSNRRDKSLTEAKLRRQLNDYKNVADQLKKQLVEMNLFNAKLLYANKLMQNRELSAKQQRAIVEALDNAKTLREATLLYKSLTESLLVRRANKGALTEGRKVLGSSSKSARSAQPKSGAGDTDRWAKLAGLKED